MGYVGPRKCSWISGSRNIGYPDFLKSKFRKSRFPEIRISGSPNAGNPDFRKSACRKSGFPKIRKSGFSEIQVVSNCCLRRSAGLNQHTSDKFNMNLFLVCWSDQHTIKLGMYILFRACGSCGQPTLLTVCRFAQVAPARPKVCVFVPVRTFGH